MQEDIVVYDMENKIEDENTKGYFDTILSNKTHRNKKIQVNSSKPKNYKLCMNSKDNEFSKKEYSDHTKYYPYLEKEGELNETIYDKKNFIIQNKYKEKEKNESFIHENVRTIYNDNLLSKDKNLSDTYFKNNKKNVQNSSNSIKSYIEKLKKYNFDTVLSIIDNDIAKKKETYNKKMIEYNDFIYTVDCMYLQNWENEHELANNEVESHFTQCENLENEGKELLVLVEDMINEVKILLQKIKRGTYINKDEMLNIQKKLNVMIMRVQKVEEENYYYISQQGEYEYFLKKIGFQKKCRDMEFHEFYGKFSKEKGKKNLYTLYWNKFKNITNAKAKHVFKNVSNLLPKS
ncbi:hypothetical protein PRELSG_0409100 [Plasmodium relictum]|uniref:Uncharacterized protein n=1 Tax=Plasmodium relictum TaxID=85471 RepID=A0A1J1H251_PLARL|nr:hypothetical protein PRELSG_0409100 [Plasmodium relictum]CRG98741.1 hypothetical protein PRELSG_0409100 [Plasmodium relictum]